MEEVTFDMSVKKKKKKSVMGKAVETCGKENVEPDVDKVASVLSSLDLDFLGSKKKRRKRNCADELFLDSGYKTEGDEAEGWCRDGNEDYTYDELLKRAVDTMREKNPNIKSGVNQKFVMRPPQVIRIGSKKTAMVNFWEACKALHRKPKHLLDYFLSELGTTGSVDSNNSLVVRGRFQQMQMETVLRRYIREYVTCHTCHSANTVLQKEARLLFLQCEDCLSKYTVTQVKPGFKAVTGKRAAIRAKVQMH